MVPSVTIFPAFFTIIQDIILERDKTLTLVSVSGWMPRGGFFGLNSDFALHGFSRKEQPPCYYPLKTPRTDF